jgi:hypothetical protein
MDIILYAKSSDGGFYELFFSFEQTAVSAKCNCRAGIFGKLCKHKLTLLSGDDSLLHDKSNIEDFNKLNELIQQTNLPQLTSQLLTIRSIIETEQREEKKIKSLIEKEIK